MGGSAIAGWRRRKRRVDGTLSAHRTREERGDLRDVLENRIGYSSHDAAIGVAWLMQSDVQYFTAGRRARVLRASRLDVS